MTFPFKCPSCGYPTKTQETQYGLRTACYICDLHSWDGKPLVDQKTHNARQDAHSAFDPIWRDEKLVSRSKAYILLAEQLGIEVDKCHMSEMGYNTAKAAIYASHFIRIHLSKRDPAEVQQDKRDRSREVASKRAKRQAEVANQEDNPLRNQMSEALGELKDRLNRESEELRQRSFPVYDIDDYPDEPDQTSKNESKYDMLVSCIWYV